MLPTNRQTYQKSPADQLKRWYQSTAAGSRLRDQVASDMALILDEWFGYHLLVVGVDIGVDISSLTRVQHISTILPVGADIENSKSPIRSLDEQLPIATESVDVVVILNTLELSEQPHQVLREAHRVLTPHGHLLVLGSNPFSLGGLWQFFIRTVTMGGQKRRSLSPAKLQDWLNLLHFSTAPIRHKLILPLAGGGRLGRIMALCDNWLTEHNIPLGSAYVMYANKMVAGYINPVKPERIKARLMGLPGAKPVVGARKSTARNHRAAYLRPVD